MERRLCRSRQNRVIAGVAGGIGEYLGIDPVFVRLFFVLLAFAAQWAALLYVVLWVLLPEQEVVPGVAPTYRRLDAQQRNLLLGSTLIVLGVLFLAREFHLFWWFNLQKLWPLVLIVAGVVLLVDRTRGVRW